MTTRVIVILASSWMVLVPCHGAVVPRMGAVTAVGEVAREAKEDGEEKNEGAINAKTNDQLLGVIGDPDEDFKHRLDAAQEIGKRRDPSLVPRLVALLKRPITTFDSRSDNWDERAAERLVNIHIIESVHALGGEADLQHIIDVVRKAGRRMRTSYYDERRHAADVIMAVGEVSVVSDLVGLTKDRDPAVVRNAVLTLGRLTVPEPPVGQDITGLPRLSEPLTFTVSQLKEEVEKFVILSHGTIRISSAAQQFIAAHNYDRGTVRRNERTLAEILKEELRHLELAYYAEGSHVVICTHGEAGVRWQRWWKQYGKDLVYVRQTATFGLRGRR